ncbi:YraN family protein [Methylobacterium gregans]|uniref:UPF0102 protein NBEOAGPD_1883 n=1 Tax=Methylobacterium gregans TaxID=374424 RepID=A0AA37HNG0_9HYPH|nr:YraN family protein [Methylobacterium gregans]MDQ0519403.1 putative endonuclease [Methylobacterium gregans]GJD78665.1 hypothetical protein NBEOAGPD_1883 [Methylobacterium gregans]GLS52956.1 UPF0102 protein [Methylobacterium gregans]
MARTTPDRSARRRAHAAGRRAEWIALAWLMLKGYRPLDLRVALAGGEIDLVMRRGTTLAFVEVKARAELHAAREAIDGRKRRLFSQAVRAWLARHPGCAGLTLRADAVFLGRRAWPEHLPDAFTIEGMT